jgi:metallo-beta-lactamase family protein
MHKALAALLLEDSAQIQENDAKYHNKGSKAQGRPIGASLYTIEMQKACLRPFFGGSNMERGSR